MLLYFPPTYAIPIMKWWEKEWGAVSVAEPLFTIYPSDEYILDPGNPLESLAKKEFLDGFAFRQFLPGQRVAEQYRAQQHDDQRQKEIRQRQPEIADKAQAVVQHRAVRCG